jgi:ligand-binding sensor domain-containing protein
VINFVQEVKNKYMKNTLQFILLLTIIPQILTAQIDTFFSMSHTKAHFIKDDTIWMVSDGGVVKRTCSTGTILATYTPANSPIPYHSATGIWVDLQHRMWLYLEEKGIAMLNGNQWTTWDVEDAHYVLAGGYNGKVAVDNDGVAWIAV